MITALGVASTVGALGAVLLYSLRWRLRLGVAAAAFSHHLMLLAPLGLVLLLAGGAWTAAVLVALALTLVSGAATAPLLAPRMRRLVRRPTAAAGEPVTVLTANLLTGLADPAALVELVRHAGADLVLLQELTPAARAGLRTAGLDVLLPHSAVDTRGRGAGSGLWSRYPLLSQTCRRDFFMALVTAEIEVGPQRLPVTVVCVHMPGPYPQAADRWVADMAELPVLLRTLAAAADAGRPSSTGGSTGRVVVGGDFNATHGNAEFRALLRGGYRDAAAVVGAGLMPTFPAGGRWPALIAIDHLLTRGVRVDGVATVALPGSDHRGVLGTLSLD